MFDCWFSFPLINCLIGSPGNCQIAYSDKGDYRAGAFLLSPNKYKSKYYCDHGAFLLSPNKYKSKYYCDHGEGGDRRRQAEMSVANLFKTQTTMAFCWRKDI